MVMRCMWGGTEIKYRMVVLGDIPYFAMPFAMLISCRLVRKKFVCEQRAENLLYFLFYFRIFERILYELSLSQQDICGVATRNLATLYSSNHNAESGAFFLPFVIGLTYLRFYFLIK